MSPQAAQKVTPIDEAKRKSTEIILIGKLDQSKQVGTDKNNNPIIENIILTPAEDTYSHPKRFCVKSRHRIGEVGSEVSVLAAVSCRPWKDSNGKYRYPHDLWLV